MFENPEIVESFLTFWRHTGSQRVGFLYGAYEPFPEVRTTDIPTHTRDTLSLYCLFAFLPAAKPTGLVEANSCSF